MRRRTSGRRTTPPRRCRLDVRSCLVDVVVTDIPGQTVVSRLGLYVQAYTLYSSVRPFGISTILGAVDKDGPSLYVVEPSGVFYVCCILAIVACGVR